MNIDINTAVTQNYFCTLPDMPYSALAQDVEFFKTDLFCSVHIPLGCWETLRGHIEGSIAGYGFF